MTELPTELAEKAQKRFSMIREEYHTVHTDNAVLRYMANDFPGYVFETERHLKIVRDLDRDNFGNAGKAYAAKIGPYQDPSGKLITEVSFLKKDEHAERGGKLANVTRSEVFDTPEEARQWINEQGLTLSEYPSVNLEQFRTGDPPLPHED